MKGSAEKLIEKFESAMTSQRKNFYSIMAGMKVLKVKTAEKNNELLKENIPLDKKDWFFYDQREKSGTYHVCNASGIITKVTLSNPEAYGVDYSEKSISLKIDALELVNRYKTFTPLFRRRYYGERTYPHLDEEALESIDDKIKKFDAEKTHFANDPYLALYWLMYFGFTFNERYEDVKTIITTYKYPATINKYFTMVMAFFDSERNFKEVNIDRTWAFDIERAYLIFKDYSYKNNNPNHFNHWWLSVKLFPEFSSDLLLKLNHLANNVELCGLWNELNSLIQEEDKKIPFTSYLFAVNPNVTHEKRVENAESFLCELLYENKIDRPSPTIIDEETFKTSCHRMIRDVRLLIRDKDLLEKTIHKLFSLVAREGNQYQEIVGVLEPEVAKKIEKINQAAKVLEKINNPSKKEATEYLDSYEDDIAYQAIILNRDEEMAKKAIPHAFFSNIDNKVDVLFSLCDVVDFDEFSKEEVKVLFGKDFGSLVNGNDDTNIDTVIGLINKRIKKHIFDFNNQLGYVERLIYGSYLSLFENAIHYPKVFNYLMKLVKEKKHEKVDEAISCEVSFGVFRWWDNEESDASLSKISEEQLEMAYDILTQWAIDNKEKIFIEIMISGDEGIPNPLIKNWLIKKLSDNKWISEFAPVFEKFDYIWAVREKKEYKGKNTEELLKCYLSERVQIIEENKK